MSTPRSTRVFKSGNSKAVRVPAHWALEPGQEVVLREEGGRYVIDPVPAADRKRNLLRESFGSMPWLKPLTPAEREFEERELDWELKQLRRG